MSLSNEGIRGGRKKQRNSVHTRCVLRAGGVLVLCICLLLGSLTACQNWSSDKENEKFRKFTEEFFRREVGGNTISIHFNLKHPEEYGIHEERSSFGNFCTDIKKQLAAVDQMENVLKTFSYGKLNLENKITYDVMKSYFEKARKNAKYLLYEEPLSLVSGIHTQLPVVLSEFALESKQDVEVYLDLLKNLPSYFDSLLHFEKMKSKEGLFMSEEAAEQVIAQCKAFLEEKEDHELVTSFTERLKTIQQLSESEMSKYMKKNALMLDCYVRPAYEKLIQGLEELKKTGKNKGGLCHLPDGKTYYEQVAQMMVGTDLSIEEMKEMTKKQMKEDARAIQDEIHVSASADKQWNPVTILKILKEKMEDIFPKPADVLVDIKYVPKEMEHVLSPAFYMIPPIDDYQKNVIYVNRAYVQNPLTLFTTLAHEGYPGHLYQTTYFADTDPDPVRNVFSTGGYIEGWATYVEMMSYYMAPVSKIQATLFQRNSSMLLGMYALADMGIHYDGWDREAVQTFFSDYGIKEKDAVERIYDLIVGAPGNYLKYYIGYLEFLELKKSWMEHMGNAFSQKDFHRAVLEIGPAPFEIVEKYIEAVSNVG